MKNKGTIQSSWTNKVSVTGNSNGSQVFKNPLQLNLDYNYEW